MSNQWIRISKDERKEILIYAANKLGRSEAVLEKDIWVCWLLDALFELPNAHPMAFKGGTSLSKVFNAINRFSEDIDITLDFRHFPDGLDPFADGVSRSQIKKLSDRLKASVGVYANDVLMPDLRNKIVTLPEANLYDLVLDGGGERITFSYPSLFGMHDEYLRSTVLLELGGRNVIDPNATHIIRTDISDVVDTVSFPEAQVVVLAAQRTFWEKATLIHIACQRGVNQTAERQSRHWYDLVMLAKMDVGQSAILDKTLLNDVVKLKSVFFNYSDANYSGCLNRQFVLIPPQKDSLGQLETDYKKMIQAGMVYDDAPTFDELLHKIGDIESAINAI